jgi:hypothetical protein
MHNWEVIKIDLSGGNSRQVWIELCQKARLDPRAVLDNQLDNLLKFAIDTSSEGKVLSTC